jgi:hypothetical protein
VTAFVSPPRWSDGELEADRLRAIARFVEERTTTVGPQYRLEFQRSKALVDDLFRATDDLLALADAEAIAERPARIRAARYLAGPPLSEDVFDVLAEMSIAKRRRLTPDLARRATDLILAGGSITFIDDLARGSYARETEVARIKCDVPVRLYDGRLLLIECKVSNTATNSVKRLNRECGDKAGKWRDKFGAMTICAAVLAGVYRQVNLTKAQDDDGLVLFWDHDLAPLEDFLLRAR